MAILLDVPAVTRTAIAYGPDDLQLGPSILDVPVVGRQAVAYGARITNPTSIVAAAAGTTQTPDLAMSLWDEANTTQIAASIKRVLGSLNWQDDPLAVGEGTFEVPTRNDAERTAADALTPGRVVRITYRGQPAWPARILAPQNDVELARLQGDLRRTIRIADMRSMLQDVKVNPANGVGARPTSELRTISWAGPEFDDSDWANAIEQQIVVSYSWVVPNTDPPWFTPWLPPDGWPVSETPVITTSYTRTLAAQRGLLREAYTVPTDGWYQMWVAAFFGAKIYVDGLKVGEGQPEPANMWLEPFVTEPFYLTAGEHIFAVDLTKPSLPDVSFAPGTLGTVNLEHCMAFNLHRLDQGDQTVIGDDTVVLKSNAGWKRLHAPSVEPCPTFGRWFWLLCQEGIARDALPATLVRTFSDTHDSNGVPWPNTGPVTLRTSDDYDAVVAQAEELGYRVRFGYSGLTLNAYAPDSAGARTGVDVSQLRREREVRRQRPNRLVVSWRGGQTVVEDVAAQTAVGRVIEDDLQLADVETEEQAVGIAEAKLAAWASADQSVRIQVDPSPAAAAVAPYVAYRPLDYVNLSVSEEAQVARHTVTEDRTGQATIVPTLYTRSESQMRALDAKLARGITGTLGGESRTATPTRWLDSGISGGFAVRFNIAPFSTSNIVSYTEDPEKGRSDSERFDRPVRLTRLTFGAIGEVTETVTVSMMKNGAKIDELFLLPGINNTVWLAMHHSFRANDELWFRVDDAGAGAAIIGIYVVAVPASPAQVKPTGRLPWN